MEEEKIDFEGNNRTFYTKRAINVFISPGKDAYSTIKQIQTSIVSSMKTVMKVDFDGAHGLQCFKCMKDGKESFVDLENGSRICSGVKQHKISSVESTCNESMSKDKELVLKRLAYKV